MKIFNYVFFILYMVIQKKINVNIQQNYGIICFYFDTFQKSKRVILLFTDSKILLTERFVFLLFINT